MQCDKTTCLRLIWNDCSDFRRTQQTVNMFVLDLTLRARDLKIRPSPLSMREKGQGMRAKNSESFHIRQCL